MKWTTIPRWITWKYNESYDAETGLMKKTKVPFTTKVISYKDESYWMTYEKAQVQCKAFNLDGIGFVLGGKYQAFDLDNCMEDPRTAALLTSLKTYSEVSPSGNGAHFLFEGPETLNKNRKLKGCEFHVNGWITYTGVAGQGELSTLSEVDIKNVLSMYEKVAVPIPVVKEKPGLSDEQVFNLCDINPVFTRLWNNDNSGYKSPSEGDLAFVNFLKRYTDDRVQLERIIKSSPRMREKFNRTDYLKATIQKADAPTATICEVTIAEEPRFQLDLPEGHLITKYLAWMTRRQDNYPEYHIAGIMHLISYYLPARQELAFGNTWNNLYYVILGHPGYSGKTSMIDPIVLINSKFPDGIEPMARQPTPESFVEMLAEYQKRQWIVDECAGLLKAIEHKPYMSDLGQLITMAYSHSPISRSRVKKKDDGGIIRCDNPHLPTIWLTTIESFVRYIPLEKLEDGMYTRPLYIAPTREKEVYPDRDVDATDISNQNAVTYHLGELLKATGDIVFRVNPKLSAWKLAERRKKNINVVESSQMSRMFEQASKLAMCITIGSQEFLSELQSVQTPAHHDHSRLIIEQHKFTIPDWAVDIAIQWVKTHQYYFLSTYKRILTGDGGLLQQLETRLRTEPDPGWVSRVELGKAVRRSGKQLDSLISDFDSIEAGVHTRNGRPRRVYRWCLTT